VVVRGAGMWRAYSSVVLGGTFLLLLLGMSLWVHSDPSTAMIDQDIVRIRGEIADASAEKEKYSGGLIISLIEVWSEVLKTTESMLQAKRLSWMRRMNMAFTVEGRTLQPQAQDEPDKIEKDIRDTEKRIAEAESEAQRYSGGLVQGLALASAATERITRSQLLLAYYSAKYGLTAPLPRTPSPDSGSEPPHNTVEDKDAL